MIVDMTQTKMEQQLCRPALKNVTMYRVLLMQLHDMGCISTQTLLNEMGWMNGKDGSI